MVFPNAKCHPVVLSIFRMSPFCSVNPSLGCHWFVLSVLVVVTHHDKLCYALGREKLESELCPKFRKIRPCKVLHEEVGWILSALNKVEIDDLFFNELPDIMVSYVNVLRTALLYGIRPDEDRDRKSTRLNSTSDYALVFDGSRDGGLIAFTDSDWAADPIKR